MSLLAILLYWLLLGAYVISLMLVGLACYGTSFYIFVHVSDISPWNLGYPARTLMIQVSFSPYVLTAASSIPFLMHIFSTFSSSRPRNLLTFLIDSLVLVHSLLTNLRTNSLSNNPYVNVAMITSLVGIFLLISLNHLK